jgi:hypothetical protein
VTKKLHLGAAVIDLDKLPSATDPEVEDLIHGLTEFVPILARIMVAASRSLDAPKTSNGNGKHP